MSVCLSVRLLHAGIVSKRLNMALNCFTNGSPTHSTFSSQQTLCQYSDEWRVMKKITIFDKYLALSRKWCKIGSLLLLWNANRKPYPSFRMVPFSMTLSDLEWLSEIFYDTKHRAVCLRQLSFLSRNIATIANIVTPYKTQDTQNGVTLKYWLKVVQDHWKWYH